MRTKDQILLENAYESISNNTSNLEYEAKLDFLKQEIIKRNGMQMPVDKLINFYHKLEEKDPELMQVKIGDFKRDILGNFFDQEKTEEPSVGDNENRGISNRRTMNQNENFVHGIQPIVEAKKKELPLALKKAIEKKTGKKFGKKNKDEPTKGFVKLAKKSGKKITSDKFKAKKK